jgi:DNA-binding CsgD family transcriptional regulator
VTAGRTTELGSVAAAIEADEAIVLTGEAGIGKSTVARVAAARTGRPLLVGGALGALRHLPLLAVERVLGRSLGPADELAAARHLERATGPGVVVLEDLHWAHATTIEAVALLAGRVAVIATVRTGDPAGDGEAVVHRLVTAGFREVALGPLDAEAAATVVRASRPDLDDRDVRAVVEAAAGNPLLLEELARSRTGGPPSDLVLALRQRLGVLDEDARRAAALLAIAGRPLPPSQLGSGFGALADTGLLATVDGGVGLRHSLLAAAIRAQLDAGEVAALHRHLAGAADDPSDRAHHLLQAGDEVAALEAARAARDRAATPGERAHWAAVALRLDPTADVDEALDAVRSVASRDALEAQRLLDAIAPTDPMHVAARDACAAVLAVHRDGDVAGAIRAHEAAAAVLDGSGSRWEAMVAVDLASLRLVLDLEAGAFAIDRAVLRAEELGHETARARITKANLLLATGRPGWDELLVVTAEEALARDDLFTAANATRQRSIGLRVAGRPAVGAAACLTLAERAEAADLDAVALDLRTEALSGLAAVGRFLEVASTGGDLLDRPLPLLQRGWLLQVTGRALAVLGHTAQATAMLEEVVRGTRGTAFEALDADELAMGLWLAGDPARAASVLRRRATEPAAMGVPPSPIAAGWIAFDLGQARTDLVARDGLPAAGGAEAAEVDALLRLGRGDFDGAAQAFGAAAAAWLPLQIEDRLRCRWASGEAARRAGRADAIDLLEAALDEAAGFGAEAFVLRARRSLAAAGVRPPSTSSTKASERRVSTLTRRELEALRLVADGASTVEAARAMGVSRRTVESFIASAVRKVGAATRAEAVVVALAGG